MSTARLRYRLGFYLALLVVLGIVIAGWWAGSGGAFDGPGTRLVAIGRLFGLLATVMILMQFFLMSRTPFMERNFDLEQYVDLHRLNGYGILLTISGHITFIVMGYAAPLQSGLWQQFLKLNTNYDDVLKATLGTIIFFTATVISVQLARKRLPYQLWFYAHLGMYLAILLVFMHQLKIGSDFAHQRWFAAFWYALYILVFGLLGYYRFLRMLVQWSRHGFRIQKVVQESAYVYSIYITGKDIEQFAFTPGQYATWRIVTKRLIWEAHPFSFSSEPGKATLRFSIKSESGNFSRQLARLQPGTPVLIDGPRGAFHIERPIGGRIILVAGGIGVAPFMGTIPALLRQGKEVHLLYAVRTRQEVSFKPELATLHDQGAHIQIFCGDMNQQITAEALTPYISADTTFYLCGPDGMTVALRKALFAAGATPQQIITERFAFA